MSLIVKENLDRFSKTFERYVAARKGLRFEALRKVSDNYAFLLHASLRQKAYKKGDIKKSLLEMLASGRGLKISKTAKAGAARAISRRKGGAKVGGWALQRLRVKHEIALRDAKRTFTAKSAKFSGLKSIAIGSSIGSKSGSDIVGQVKSIAFENEDQFSFSWGNFVGRWSAMAAVGLTNKKRVSAFNEAMMKVIPDMEQYIKRKTEEAGRRVAAGGRS